MHHQSSDDHEEKSVDRKIIKSKSSSDSVTKSSKLPSSRRHLHKSNRSRIYPELKRYNSLCPELLQDRDSFLEVRQSIASTSKGSSLVTINVGGNRFQTYLSSLESYPNTLLGNEEKRKVYWNSKNEEYFFDRHRSCFESILYYYQSNGRLRRPAFVPLDTFLEEISFSELGSEATNQVHQSENLSLIKQIEMPRILWRRYLWFFFEFPQHSFLSRLINVFYNSFLFIISY